MRIISRKRLVQFWMAHREAETSLRSWFAMSQQAKWKNLAEVQTDYPHADLVGDCVVFNIGGNKYRLIVHVSYRFGRVLVKFVGTHAEYNRVDPKDVSWRKK